MKGYNIHMASIQQQDIPRGKAALSEWSQAATQLANESSSIENRLTISPRLPRNLWAMAVRYSLYLLEKAIPGQGVEVRVAPWGAVKVLEGPASDPHNLTPPDVIELEPAVWLRLATGITSWQEEREAGNITAVGERDNLEAYLPVHE